MSVEGKKEATGSSGGGRAYKEGGRDRSDVFTRLGTPNDIGNHQRLGGEGRVLSLNLPTASL